MTALDAAAAQAIARGNREALTGLARGIALCLAGYLIGGLL